MSRASQLPRTGGQLLKAFEVLVGPASLRQGPDGRVGDAAGRGQGGDAMRFGGRLDAVERVGNRIRLNHAREYCDVSHKRQEELRHFALPYGIPPGQASWMAESADKRREAFRAWVDANGGVQPVAKRSGVPASTLYSYLKGNKGSTIRQDNLEKLATAFDVPVDDMFGANRRMVPLVGYVGAGAAAHFYDAGQGPFGEVDAPDWSGRDTVAVEIKGTSLGPWFDSWVVYYDDVRSPVTPDLHGEVCIVGLEDGRVLVKKLEPSRTPGTFHLLSQTEPPILDCVVLWAARVREMRPH